MPGRVHPVLQMIARGEEELRLQAEMIIKELGEGISWQNHLRKKPFRSRRRFPSGRGNADYAVVIEPKEERAEELSCRLRRLPLPVIGHIKNEKVWLRCVQSLRKKPPCWQTL